MDMAFSCKKNACFLGAHKIGAAMSGPRIADKKFYGHEDFSEESSLSFVSLFFLGKILDNAQNNEHRLLLPNPPNKGAPESKNQSISKDQPRETFLKVTVVSKITTPEILFFPN